jgi:hypothetical protein
MRRLLQFATLLLLAALFMPVHEILEDDVEDLWNDTSFAVFAFVCTICLVLLVCKLISAGLLKPCIVAVRAVLCVETAEHTEGAHTFIFVVPPLSPIPLRI